MLELPDLAFHLVAPHLLVEGVKKLLTGGGAGKSGAVVESSSKAPEVEQAFRRAVEGHAHAVEQVDDGGSSVAHRFYRWLVRQKVATVDGVVKVLPGRVAFALQVLGCVDASLGAHRVRALDGDNGEQVDFSAHLGDFYNRCQACQAAAHHYDFRI
jgi:hypothetical protein